MGDVLGDDVAEAIRVYVEGDVGQEAELRMEVPGDINAIKVNVSYNID